MEGLTAKVFRTYNASYTFQDQLKQLTPSQGTVAEKIAAYNKANKEVAILCNHQKTVSRTHGDSMAKLGDKVCFVYEFCGDVTVAEPVRFSATRDQVPANAIALFALRSRPEDEEEAS
jgi:hypothetical protein